jgi:ribosome modulation factor
MLPGLQLLNQLKRAGREAAYDGALLVDCPYTTPDLKQAWEAGWQLGHQDRQEDLHDNKHPSLSRRNKHVHLSRAQRQRAG